MSMMNCEQLDLLHEAQVKKDAVRDALKAYKAAVEEAQEAGLTYTQIMDYTLD